MRHPRSLSTLLAVVSSLAACGRQTDAPSGDSAAPAGAAAFDTAVTPEAAARARTAANTLGRQLQTKLFAALDSGGPARAVAFCADSAQAWTERATEEGVYLKRVTLRARNPQNRPDAEEERLLRRLDSLHREKALPDEMVLASRGPDGARVTRYVRPIFVQERCLACHGEPAQLAPGVRQILAARYPQDQATGYRAGDLRGMISVRVRD